VPLSFFPSQIDRGHLCIIAVVIGMVDFGKSRVLASARPTCAVPSLAVVAGLAEVAHKFPE
jgi:hypothetical protein